MFAYRSIGCFNHRMFAYRSILHEQARPAVIRESQLAPRDRTSLRDAAPALRDLTISIDALAD